MPWVTSAVKIITRKQILFALTIMIALITTIMKITFTKKKKNHKL